MAVGAPYITAEREFRAECSKAIMEANLKKGEEIEDILLFDQRRLS